MSAELILLAFALSLDGFALCAAWALAHPRLREAALLPLVFTCVQPLCVGIGWVAGEQLEELAGPLFRAAAALLLAGIGARMGIEALRSDPNTEVGAAEEAPQVSLAQLFVLAVASNVDALLAGAGSASIAGPFWLGLGVMAGFAALFGGGGGLIGKKIGERAGRPAGLLAGLLLMGLAVRIALPLVSGEA